VHARWRKALELAGDQYALVTRHQMRRLDLTDRMIAGATSDGLLYRVGPGVFRVAGAPQTERMAIAAAALASDGGVACSTAGSLFRLELPLPAVPIEVVVDVDSSHRRVARVEIETATRSFHPVRIHRRLPTDEPSVVVDGICCTDAARTLIDVACRLGLDDLEDGFERARKLGLVSAASLARRFERLAGRGHPGAPKVRALLANARPNPLDSKLEGRTWRMLRRSLLPEPVRQLRVDVVRGRWYRIDFAWPELLVAVEAEGFEWHGSRAQWKVDRMRVAALERLGWRVLVVTWDDVTRRPAETMDRIAMAFAERRRLAAGA
jgi:very-short-patch-repair endonuclease/predicted transcriptional regulator of viral defense system